MQLRILRPYYQIWKVELEYGDVQRSFMNIMNIDKISVYRLVGFIKHFKTILN